jgi:catechol 2,3-dioxygenase-like lactoylglutathione lyase family enzyme
MRCGPCRSGASLDSVIDHISLQVSDVPTSKAFYAAVLEPLGITLGHDDGTTAGFFGPDSSSFWLGPAERADDRELHIAFRAPSREVVRAFHQAALGIGAEILNAPRIFPEYSEDYYGAFIRDPDGHNIEAVRHGSEE